MSLRAILWALETRRVADTTDALVLVALAEHVGSDADPVAWPSVERLGVYARCSRRTVQRALRRLEDPQLDPAGVGLIERAPEYAPTYLPVDKRPTAYRLRLDPALEPPPPADDADAV